MAKKPAATQPPEKKALPKPEFVQDFDLTKLAEHPANPRELTRDGERKLGDALDRFGMLDAIVVNQRPDGSHVILGGHQRWKVLLKRGETKGLVTVTHVDETREKELLLLLNGHHGQWEPEKLTDLLEQLREQHVPLESLGLDGQPQFEQVLAMTTPPAPTADAPANLEEVSFTAGGKTHTCPECGCRFDKTGRVVEAGGAGEDDEDDA